MGFLLCRNEISDPSHQIEVGKESKYICKINTSQGLFKMCKLPQELKNSFPIFQVCIDSTLKEIKGFVISQVDVFVYEITKEQFNKR